MMELAGILPDAAPTLDNRVLDTDPDVDARKIPHVGSHHTHSPHPPPVSQPVPLRANGHVPSADAPTGDAVPVYAPLTMPGPSAVPRHAASAHSQHGDHGIAHGPLRGSHHSNPPEASGANVGRRAAPDLSDQSRHSVTASAQTSTVPNVPPENTDADARPPAAFDEPGEQPVVTKAEERRQRQIHQTQELFEVRLDEAVRTLQKKQEPGSRKMPRLLARNIALLESLPVSDLDRIAKCLDVIGRSRSPFAVEVLREYSTAGPSSLRSTCIEALGRIDCITAKLGLVALLKDGAPEIVDQAVRCLIESNTVELVPALVCLGAIRPRLGPISTTAFQQLYDDDRRKMIQPLRDDLTGKNVLCSAYALTILSKLDANETLKVAVKLLKHPAGEVRVAAIEALARANHRQTVRLLNAAMNDTDGRVRSAAATALSTLFSPKSVTLLIAALHDADHSVRRNAAKTLNGMQEHWPQIAEAASKAVADQTDPLTMEYLLEIVGRGGTEDALQTLQQYLDDDSGEFRHRAINTLRKLKTRKAAKMLLPFLSDDDDETRELATRAMGSTGEQKVLPALRTLLKEDLSVKVRAAAARSLGELKDETSLMDLEESLHDDRRVACQAVIAIGQIGKKASLPALLSQLRSPASEIRYHACNAVAELGELANCDLLEELLEDREPMVSRAAEQALRKLGGEPTSFQRNTRKLRRVAQSALVYVMPSTLSGVIPGGRITFLAASALLIVCVLGFSAFSVSSFNATSYSGPVSHILAAGMSDDAARVVAIRRFNVLEAWNVADGSLINRMQLEQKLKAVLPAGDEFLIFTQEQLMSWNPQLDRNGTSMDVIPDVDVSGAEQIRSLPDGKTVYLIAPSGRVDVFGVTERKVSHSFELPPIAGSSLAVSPDQKFLAYGDEEGKLHLCSPHDGKELHSLSAGRFLDMEPGSKVPPVSRIAFSSDGQYMAISFERGSLVLVEMEKLQSVKSVELPVSQMVFHPGKNSLIVVNVQGLHVLEEEFGNHRQSEKTDLGDARFIQLTPDAKSLLSFVDENTDLWISNLEELELTKRLSPKT
ncbi:MAG: HEAT repeat domain-containing protein [Planctomycetaceae bacterium]